MAPDFGSSVAQRVIRACWLSFPFATSRCRRGRRHPPPGGPPPGPSCAYRPSLTPAALGLFPVDFRLGGLLFLLLTQSVNPLELRRLRLGLLLFTHLGSLLPVVLVLDVARLSAQAFQFVLGIRKGVARLHAPMALGHPLPSRFSFTGLAYRLVVLVFLHRPPRFVSEPRRAPPLRRPCDTERDSRRDKTLAGGRSGKAWGCD